MEIINLDDKELVALGAVLSALVESDSGILTDGQVIGIVGDEQTARKICGLIKQHESATGYKYGGEYSLKRTELTAAHYATKRYQEAVAAGKIAANQKLLAQEKSRLEIEKLRRDRWVTWVTIIIGVLSASIPIVLMLL